MIGRQQELEVPAQGCFIPAHAKATLPTRPVTGHDQAASGSKATTSASRATAARDGRRHIRIQGSNTLSHGTDSSRAAPASQRFTSARSAHVSSKENPLQYRKYWRGWMLVELSGIEPLTS